MPAEKEIEALLALVQSNPDEARKLLATVTKHMLVPHSVGQREVLESDTRFMVLCAGRRWGKSQVGAAKALREARTPKKVIWWVAPVYRNVKNGYKAVIEQCPPDLWKKPPPPDSAFDAGRAVRLELKNGSTIQFFSAERHEGMLGASCDFLIMDEAATMPEHVWTQTIRATLADRQGRALFISTPRGKNWFYRLWQLGQDDLEENYVSWHFPSFTNPTIPAEEFKQMEKEMPKVQYEQEVLADFVSAAASVFRFNYDREKNNLSIVEMEEPLGHVVLGIDLAKSHDFTVLCGVRAEDRKPCYHDRFNEVSWPQQRRLIREAVEEILETASGITVMIDSTGVGDVVYDDLSEEGLDAIPIKFTPQWKTAAVQLLSADLERGEAFIHQDQVKEFESYSASLTDTGRWKYEGLPHDDEVSAALLAHWGVVHSGVPNVQTLIVGGPENSDPLWDGYGSEESRMVDTGLPTTHAAEREPTAAELMNNPNLWS
jgi:hypothetical protein